MEHKKSTPRKILILSAVALVLIFAVTAILYVADGIRYPHPAGEYQVGRTKMYLTDTSREEVFSEVQGDLRELPVTIYYPADPEAGDKRAVFASRAVSDELAAYNGFPSFVLDSVKPNSFIDAKPASGEAFPVLMFSGGLYGQAPFYGSLLESIASEGYVVVSVEHPYSEIAAEIKDGSVIQYNDAGTAFFDVETDDAKLEELGEDLADVWTADMLFVLDSLPEMNAQHDILKGSMNLEKTGIFGHSFGGAASIQCLQQREDLLAGINLDGSLFGKQKTDPVHQPIAFYNNSQEAILSAIFFQEKVAISETSEACYHLMLMDSTHDSFATDAGLLYDKFPFAKPANAAQIKGIDALNDLSFYITAFFDRYLLGQEETALEQGCSPEHLHIICEKYEKSQASLAEDKK